MNKTNKVLNLDDIADGFNGAHDRTGTLVGSKQFKLSVDNSPVFKLYIMLVLVLQSMLILK